MNRVAGLRTPSPAAVKPDIWTSYAVPLSRFRSSKLFSVAPTVTSAIKRATFVKLVAGDTLRRRLSSPRHGSRAEQNPPALERLVRSFWVKAPPDPCQAAEAERAPNAAAFNTKGCTTRISVQAGLTSLGAGPPVVELVVVDHVAPQEPSGVFLRDGRPLQRRRI